MRWKTFVSSLFLCGLVSCSGGEGSSSIFSSADSFLLSSLPEASSLEMPSSLSLPSISYDTLDYSYLPQPSPYEDIEFNFDFWARLSTDSNGSRLRYQEKMVHNDGVFLSPARAYQTQLAETSFAASFMAPYRSRFKSLVESIGFSDVCYYEEPDLSEKGMGTDYDLAYKVIGDFTLVLLGVGGYSVGDDWAGNFILGESGPAIGFELPAQRVYERMKEYALEKKGSGKLKYWIVGYSRAGGIANDVATKLMEDKELAVDEDDAFVYTFEAPGVLPKEMAKPYPNIFNLVNSKDITPFLPPERYGLFRAGKSINIATPRLESIVTEYDPRLSFPAFTPGIYEDEEGFLQYLFQTAAYEPTAEDRARYGDPDVLSLATRENYARGYQASFACTMKLVFNLSSSTIEDISAQLSGKNTFELFRFLNKDALYYFLEPILDEHKEKYDKKELKDACNVLVNYLNTCGGNLLSALLFEKTRTNFARVAFMHGEEVIFPALRAFNKGQ